MVVLFLFLQTLHFGQQENPENKYFTKKLIYVYIFLQIIVKKFKSIAPLRKGGYGFEETL